MTACPSRREQCPDGGNRTTIVPVGACTTGKQLAAELVRIGSPLTGL